jgi:ribosomal protein S18 acetylase RimI-like enzyme
MLNLSTEQERSIDTASVSFRPARPDENDLIAEIMFGDPPQEAFRVCEGIERARRFCYMQVREPGLGMGWDRTVFGILDDEPVTVLQAGTQLGGMSITPSLVWNTLRILGLPRTIRSLPYISAQRRVNAPAPEGSYHIAELHTHPDHRNRGLGKAALEYAEARAREEDAPCMSLVTTVINPARHLYERQGFRVVETRTDVVYERMTGIPGRNLMVKELS